jgi:hypothetical protein
VSLRSALCAVRDARSRAAELKLTPPNHLLFGMAEAMP